MTTPIQDTPAHLRSIYEWRIFDADAETVLPGSPVSESAALRALGNLRTLSPETRYELHSRARDGEWEVAG